MKKKKELEEIRKEKERVLEDLRESGITLEDYDKLWNTYKNITEVEEEMLNGKKNRSWVPTIAQIGIGLLTAAGTIAGVIYLGKLSYGQDQELNLCNGRVFNLASKLLNLKTDFKI